MKTGPLFAATALWGAASAAVAVIDSPKSAPIVAAGASIALLSAACIGRQPIRGLFIGSPKLFLLLGLIEAANIALYFGALAIGPTPVVVALHLTAPMMLIALDALRGKRRVNLLLLAELAAIILAISLVVGDPQRGSGMGSTVLACVMALGSAAAVAVLITLISRSSGQRPAAASAGIQLGLAALFVSPMLAFGVGSPEQVLSLMAVGGALLGPGFLLYWIGMRKSDATTAGIIGLNEVLVASLLVGLVGTGGITLATVIAGALIVIAVGLERFSLRGVC